MKAIIFDFSRTLYDRDKEKLYPGAKELVARFKVRGVKTFLISRGDQLRKSLVASLGLGELMDEVLVVCKKDTEIYTDLLKRWNIQVNQTVVVGDKIRGDIVVGNRAGCITIRVQQGKYADEVPNNPEEEPLYTVENIPALKERLDWLWEEENS